MNGVGMQCANVVWFDLDTVGAQSRIFSSVQKQFIVFGRSKSVAEGLVYDLPLEVRYAAAYYSGGLLCSATSDRRQVGRTGRES